MNHLTAQEEKALMLFKERLLAALPGQIEEIKLFGSKARGEANKLSDMDVLVTLARGDWHDNWPIHRIASEIGLETDVDLSIRIVTAKVARRLRQGGSPFMMNVDREGLVV